MPKMRVQATAAPWMRMLDDPSITERYPSILLSDEKPSRRPLQAAKLLLSLARRAAARGEYSTPILKAKACINYYATGSKVVENGGAEQRGREKGGGTKKEEEQPAGVNGKLIHFAGPPTVDGAKAPPPYDEDEDPRSPRRSDIEKIDQAGRLWSGLAKQWTKRAEFDRAKATFEAGLADVVTVRDFTQIFDAYAEYSETLISGLMGMISNAEPDDEDATETEKDLDQEMKDFEELMDRRPFLVNEVLLRRNPNDVQEWEKRITLYGESDEKVAETYTKSLKTINPKKATVNYYMLYANLARFYEEGGAGKTAAPNMESARKVLERATKVSFKTVDDLAEIWYKWQEYDEAIYVMQRAAAVPKNTKINYHHPSFQSNLVDLEGSVETTKAVYDKILELRIANTQIIVNYAGFLEEKTFEIWNIYLAKFVKRYGGKKLERARDLFEQALEQCPQKHCKPLFLMYAQLEEEHGLAKRSMSILDRACQAVADEGKFEMYTVYIAKATANFGLPATRPIYEKAIEVLPNRQTAQMCLRFAAMERKLGEIDRARAIYAYASQFCDPQVETRFWQEWNSFEMEHGWGDTFQEMLRIKRSVQAQYNTEASYLAAQALSFRQGGAQEIESEHKSASDPMAAMEREALGTKGPSFVPSKDRTTIQQVEEAPQGNADEIEIDDEDP
ncbi:pre-mRNA-splicing factor syf1 [Tulasnella sp. 417]|nr:pre-mRNA-splicing factor syf1 [Tulasnella sp. 417]